MKDSQRNRRAFIKSSIAGASAALLATPALSSLTILERATAKEDGKTIKRPLGNTGIVLPIVSMGVMRADNPGLVRAALQAGFVHLDTAHGYQKGKNEQMLGDVLKDYPRESFVISTKIPPDDRESFLEKLDTSLERLKMKYVDILYLHGLSSKEDVLSADYLDALSAARKSGKARFVGVSTHKNEPEVILAAVESGVYNVVLTSVNFKQDHYSEMKKAIAKAAGAGIGIVAMKTMAGGFFDKEKTKPVNCKAALKWVLQDENVTTAIPGITTFDMLTENAGVNQDLTMTEKEKGDLALGYSEPGLYCQGCERCIPDCPKRLPIPDIMRSYMYAYGYNNASMAQTLLADLKLPSGPCTDCAECRVRCAKGFNVAEKIADVTRLTSVPGEFLSG
jgi:predicted aldo/keto reductase-like oxidoreductase